MATFTGKLYGVFPADTWAKVHDLSADTIKVMATTSSYTPDQDVHDEKADVTNEVSSGGGYTTGGETLASKTIGYTAGTNVTKFDAADVVWSSATFTFRNLVIYNDTSTNDRLIGYQAGDANVTGGGGNLTAVWHADGIITDTVA